LVDAVDQESRPTVLDQLGHRAEPVSDHRGAGRQGLHDRQPKGFGEVDQVQQRRSSAEQCVSLASSDGPDVGDPRLIDMRGHSGVEVLLVVDDAGDHERHARTPCNLDGEVRALVRVDSPQEQQIALGCRREREAVQFDAMVDGRGVGEIGMSIGVTDRDVVADVVVGAVRRHDSLGRETVDRGHDGRRDESAVGQRQEVELVGQHVEVGRSLERRCYVQRLEHLDVVPRRLVVTVWRDGMQSAGCARVRGGEERYLVAECDQALGQGRGDLLPRPVALRRGPVGDGGQHPDAQAHLEVTCSSHQSLA